MTSIDDLFKSTSSNLKRKLEVNHDANAVYKASKLSPDTSIRTNGHAAVDDVEEEAAGPELPPDLEDPVNDEDGRFFGGGVTGDTADVLDYIDGRDHEDAQGPEKIDASWLRKTALSFERRISKNTELRAKFEGNPEKFMSSEADLDADIKTLSILAEHAELYEDFAKLGCAGSLVSLLSHENTDIAIDAIEIINELTDDNVNAEQHQWDFLVDALVDADLLTLLYDNVTRMDEELDSDRAGIYHILNVLENLSSRAPLMTDVGTKTKFLPWLLTRARKIEATTSQNKQYSAEILAILLQSSSEMRTKFLSLDGVDICLQLVSPFRKKDPAKGSDEEEWMENIFDCLVCCVDDLDGKDKFADAEGVELSLIMLREGKASKPPALRLLDHALGGVSGGRCCTQVVDAAGLKAIFTLLAKKPDRASTEHLVGILASLLRSLPAESDQRIRLLAKFNENDWRVIDKLMQIRRELSSGIAVVDKDIAAERADLPVNELDRMSDEWLSRRLDAGLFTLQTVDTILAWLIAEDQSAEQTVVKLLAEKGEDLEVIKKTLQDQLAAIDATGEDQDPDGRDMLGTLVTFL